MPIRGYARKYTSHYEIDKYRRIKDYSENTRKIGFQSRYGLCHLALKTKLAQNCMKELKKNCISKKMYITFQKLKDLRKILSIPYLS